MKLSKILFATFIAMGTTSSWANLTKPGSMSEVCSPKIHFKLPNDWARAYLLMGGNAVAFPAADADRWTTIDLDTAQTNNDQYFFINSINDLTCYQSKCVTSLGVKTLSINPRDEGFTCSMFGEKDRADVWIQEHPDEQKAGQIYMTIGNKPDVKDFYFFAPQTREWMNAEPIINEDGVERKMYLDAENCGWYYRRYIDEPIPKSVVIRRDEDETMDDAIGMEGNWAQGAAKAIPLQDMFNAYSTDAFFHDALYFVADEESAALLPASNMGWSTELPVDIIGNCSYNLAALIYDTDASLHPSFSCWSQGVNAINDGCQAPDSTAAQGVDKTTALNAIYSCIGVTTGIVEKTLGKDKKPKLTEAGKKCFIDEKYFNQLFTPTKNVNEMTCFDMTFTRSKDGKWEFDSDYFTSPGLKIPVQGGFYPVEATTDADVRAADSTQTPVPAARTKRSAEGPVFYGPLLRQNDSIEQIPKIDIFCNGPGWSGGFNCEGLFADGDATTDAIQTNLKLGIGDCVFGWSCGDKSNAPEGWPFFADDGETPGTMNPRWNSTVSSAKGNGGRNQHFCFESHAQFRFKKNLKFSFRGDDDIWVYIDNKLAVDLGGTHLAAPAYVDLDKFLPDAKVGKSYDIDIYFCDRRTTMSNVRIKTNMFIEQTHGISIENNKLCYRKASGGTCAAAMGAISSTDDDGCEEIETPITYMLSTDKTGTDPTKTLISGDEFAASPKQFDGSIDVTDPTAPIVNAEKLKDYLPSGMYYLIIKIGDDIKAIPISIKGNISIVNRAAFTVDGKGKRIPYEFKSNSMAGYLQENKLPDAKQLIPLYISSLMDPCSNETNCKDSLEISTATGSSYSLEVSNNKAVFYEMDDGQLSIIDPSSQRTIKNEIDTIYVTIPLDKMSTNEEKVSINVKGDTRKANLKFFVPKLAFVDSDSTYEVISSDKDSTIRSKGVSYDFHIIALNIDNSPCDDCNFPITKGSKTSEGLNIISGNEVVKGRVTITVQSSMIYEKCSEKTCSGAATLQIVGPQPELMQIKYSNLQFQEPPIPAPIFADIFDAHGKKPSKEMKIPTPYFSMEQKYLDGIGDSVVVYYHRNFHKDSLPEKIAVFWENDKDSVVFKKDEIKNGATCGSSANLDKSHCLNKIALGGKKFSKNVKTSGKGTVKSWTTYTAKGKTVKQAYKCILYDRIAPIILSATAVSNAESKKTTLKIEFSEKLQKTKTADSHGDKVFSFYINSTKKAQFVKGIAPASEKALDKKIDSVLTVLYNQSSTFPQVGDYISFRSVNGEGLIGDQSDYASAPTGDSIRPSSDAAQLWNVSLGYDTETHLPAPWVQITKGTTEEKNDGKNNGKDEGKDKDKDNGKDSPEKTFAKPSFRVKMTAPFEFAIVLDESLPSLAKKYTVMDMMGHVVSAGELDSKDTRVKVSTTGSYVIKVGLSYRRVNVK